MLTFLAIVAVSLFWVVVAALWSDHRHRQAMREAEERAVLWQVRATRLNLERVRKAGQSFQFRPLRDDWEDQP